jgi:hypothetical protein
MIQLNPDCLIFDTPEGKHIPCSAEVATLQLMGGSAPDVDLDVVQNASAAVLHYFKHELHQESVSVGDFAEALEKVFVTLGVPMPAGTPTMEPRLAESDLARLAREAGDGWELMFFAGLRQELKRLLADDPSVVRFHGLRECAMRLAGTPRWGRRSQALSDQIVVFLRSSWSVDANGRACAMVIL